MHPETICNPNERKQAFCRQTFASGRPVVKYMVCIIAVDPLNNDVDSMGVDVPQIYNFDSRELQVLAWLDNLWQEALTRKSLPARRLLK